MKRVNTNVSAGVMLYRRTSGSLEVLLAHPGGPFWRNRDEGAWTIPKGVVEKDEDLLAAACREFNEETGFEPIGPKMPLGFVRLKSGKLVHAWACEGDADPALSHSNMMSIEWPRGSRRFQSFPEVDRCEWFDLPTARIKINVAQAELIDRLEASLAGTT